MAGAFSGHLLHAFNSNLVTSGAMAFDPRAHGPSVPQAPFTPDPLTDDSPTAHHIAALQAKLNKKLGPEYISQRPGPGGGPKLTYAEGWKIINLANEVFGFNGWSSSIVSITTDFVDCNEASKRFDVGVTAIVRVTLRDGVYHEDVGYGMMENVKSKAAALDKCKKEATTDALKRTLRNFGNLLGNCLYDKVYAQEVVKIKVPPAKFDRSELHRRPEFEERPQGASSPAHGQPVAGPSTLSVKVEQQPETPVKCIPRHIRQEMAAAKAQGPTPGPSSKTAPNAHAPVATNQKASGLATPVQTPAQPARPPPPRQPAPPAVATSPLAHTRSAPDRTPPAPAPPPMPGRASSAGNVANTSTSNACVDEDDEDDLFPLSTQDGALFAAADLGNADVGRPIDYDEGPGGVSVMDDGGDTSMFEGGPGSRSSSAVPQPARAPPVTCRSGGSASGGQPHRASSTLGEATKQFRPAETPAVGDAPTPRGPPPQKQIHVNPLKRAADLMQAGFSSSATRGMGLAQRQQQVHDESQGSDPKRFKR